MRWLLIHPGRYEDISKPWVELETPDRDSAVGFPPRLDCIAVRLDEALADPRWRDAVRAWQRGDDRAYLEDLARFEAEREAEEILEAFG